MSDGFVRDATVFGFSSGQHWVFVTLGLIALGIFVARTLDR
jgi:hypothetical protein